MANPIDESVDQVQPQTTTPPSRPTMDFPDALRQVMVGRRITKREWGNPEICIFMAGGRLVIQKKEGLFPIILSDGDLFGTDWVTADHFVA